MKLKEIFKFLVGFQTAHVVFHIFLELSDVLPASINLGVFKYTVTRDFNSWAIIINLIILLVLVYLTYFRKTDLK